MAGILATQFTNKAPEVFDYHASIIRVERNYENYQSTTTNIGEALAHKDLDLTSLTEVRSCIMKHSQGEPN